VKVDDVSIGDLVRVWGWEELVVVLDIYFDLSEQEWCLDAYGLESGQRHPFEGLSFDLEEITIVSRA
jgi:hypothetical protein